MVKGEVTVKYTIPVIEGMGAGASVGVSPFIQGSSPRLKNPGQI